MGLILMITLISIAILFWFWAISDITRSRFKNPYMSTVWVLVVLFFPVVGSICYLLLRNKLVTNKRRKFQPKFNRNN
ncbi:PLDc N-terminal domain-containing protein [Winogradskyella sp. F6397]|uniref:PLDc N-terminal domain-containing protein n=1 Tax=Winogradskyella marina TaxID=2785530 RepID=A0ABS0EII7_9FLAO|nr:MULTISPECIES: PLDc N-terminal domain-containing protein [Winogradskyella]MBF8150276.1 PLDc N-terminal domain-containing protein [Winogradskyella marina]